MNLMTLDKQAKKKKKETKRKFLLVTKHHVCGGKYNNINTECTRHPEGGSLMLIVPHRSEDTPSKWVLEM